MVRTMKTKRTAVRPFETTVGKNRRKIVPDSINLADLGCHAFTTTPATTTAVRFALSSK